MKDSWGVEIALNVWSQFTPVKEGPSPGDQMVPSEKRTPQYMTKEGYVRNRYVYEC
jgi:hypothetical protein